jgi:nucleoid DNA-binding protein
MAKSKSSKVTAKKAPIKKLSLSNVDKAFTKGQLFTTLAGCTGLQRKEISTLFDELGTVIAAHLKKQGPGQFTIPGLVKISVKHKPATKARKGVNPFTGEEMMFKAKPARNVVKVRPLQRLKAMV